MPALPALELFLGLLCNSPASTHGEEGLLGDVSSGRERKLLSLPLPNTKGQRRLSDPRPREELGSPGCAEGAQGQRGFEKSPAPRG